MYTKGKTLPTRVNSLDHKKNKTKTVCSAWRNTRLSRILRRGQVTIELIKDQGT